MNFLEPTCTHTDLFRLQYPITVGGTMEEDMYMYQDVSCKLQPSDMH